MLPGIPPTEASLLLLPLFVASSPRPPVRLAGSGFVFTIKGRFFIVTVAHVANQFRKETLALRGPQGYVFSENAGRSFFSTSGGNEDWADLAVGEVLPTTLARLGNFVRFVDLPCFSQNFVIAEGMPVAFIGFPKPANRRLVDWNQDPRPMMIHAHQVPFVDSVYKTKFLPQVHICATFPWRHGYVLGTSPGTSRGPFTSPDPDGLSGGLVFRLDESAYQRGMLSPKGIIGVGIEHPTKRRDMLVGMHFSGVFEMLRARWPELSPALPILNLETGTYVLG